jgi:hypothetical protein
MQCASCHHAFEPEISGDAPITCPACGSLVEAAPVSAVGVATATAVAPTGVKTAKAAISPGRARGALNDMLLSFLVVAALLIAVGSTWVALKAVKERDQLKGDFAESSKAVDGMLAAAANTSRLKGPANAEARKEIFAPAIAYYQYVLTARGQDPEHLDEATAAAYHLAGLQAKSGAGACVSSLSLGMDSLRKMDELGYDISRFPSLNANALKMTTPLEWGIMKDTPMEIHAGSMLITFQVANGLLNQLAVKYPQSTVFRDDLAALLRISATLQANLPPRVPAAISAWKDAIIQLETLVRDQPGNADFQARLLEALVGAANLQKREGKTDEAVVNLKRAVEIREQMAAANPEDKALAQELAKAKTELEKMQAGAAAKPEAGATESAAADSDEAPVQ